MDEDDQKGQNKREKSWKQKIRQAYDRSGLGLVLSPLTMMFSLFSLD